MLRCLTLCMLSTCLVSARAFAESSAPPEPSADTTPSPIIEPSNIARRPLSLAVDAGLAAPTGFFGATLGYTLPDSGLWTPELGFGLGLTGWQVAAQAKKFVPLGAGTWSHFTFQAGPSVSMIGKPVGLFVPTGPNVIADPDRIYWVAWINAGVGWEARFGWGGLLRVSLGGAVNVFNTQADLCKGTQGDKAGSSPCTPGHMASGPEIARNKWLPWLGFSYGWSL